MPRSRSVVYTALLLSALATVVRGEHPAKSIPDNCAAIFHFKSLDGYTSNARDFLNGIGGAATILLPGIDDVYSGMFELRDRDAVDTKAAAMAVLFPVTGRRPPVAWYVKAKSEKSLRQMLSRGGESQLTSSPATGGFTKWSGGQRDVYTQQVGEFTVYTLSDDVVSMYAKAAKKLGKVYSESAFKQLAGGDASLLVNARYLTKEYGREIENAKLAFVEAIEAAAAQQPPGQTADVLKAYTELGKKLFAMTYDVQWVCGNTKLNGTGAIGNLKLGAKPGSAAAKFVASMADGDTELLELLPDNAPLYGVMKLEYSNMMADMMGMLIKDDALLKKTTEMMKAAKVGGTAFSFGWPSSPKSGIHQTMVQEAGDANKLQAAYRAFASGFKEVKQQGFTQKMKVKTAAEQLKSKPVDITETSIVVDDDGGPQAMILKQMYTAMFGGDSLQTRGVVLENTYVQVSGNDSKFLRQTIEGMSSGKGVVGLLKAYSNTRDKLPETSTALMMIDIPAFVNGLADMLQQVPIIGAGLANLPVDLTARNPKSFLGVNIRKSGDDLEVSAYLPTLQVKGILNMVPQPAN